MQHLPIPNRNQPIAELVVKDLELRTKHGIKEYGVALQPWNGRDAMLDLYQEVLDASVYCRQVMVEREKARELLWRIFTLVVGRESLNKEECIVISDAVKQILERTENGAI